MRIEGEKLLCDVVKPFDLIVNCSDLQLWRSIIDAFRNREIEYGFNLDNFKTILGIQVPIK